MRKSLVTIVAVIAALGMLAIAMGCSGSYGYRTAPARTGPPPPWAPAHGARARHHYRYYPGAQVYYDSDRRIYFYISGGTWISGSRLPATVSISGSYVILDMDDDMPYRHHEEVRKYHPSGHMEKQHEGDRDRDKGKVKSQSKDNDDRDKVKGKTQSKGESKGKGNDDDRDRDKGKGKSKGKDNDDDHDKGKGKDKDKDKKRR